MTAWKLYWVTDDRTGGTEDCFIIARSEEDLEAEITKETLELRHEGLPLPDDGIQSTLALVHGRVHRQHVAAVRSCRIPPGGETKAAPEV